LRTGPIGRALRGLAAALAVVSGFAVLLLAFAICVDIVARKFFAYSIEGTDEIGGYVLAAVGSLGLSHALLQRGHTRVDIVIPFLSRTAQAAVNIVALVSLLGYALFIAWYALDAFRDTIELDSRANSPLQTPLWLPQIIWVFGAWCFVVVIVWALVNAFALWRHHRHELNRRYGPLTAVQEVTELVHELEQDRRRKP
jgi:TRAP-type C4-dicarboxylate transport system permease small subunit